MNKSGQVIEFSKIKATCSNCNLHELCLPHGLQATDLKKLEVVVKGSHPIEKGKHLYRTDDIFESFYAIRSGSVKVYVINESGEEQIIGFYFPGEIIGFDGIEHHKHLTSAVALETTTFCSLPYDNINDICMQIPDLQNQMFRLLSREISNENQLLLTINKRSAEERIASFLISLSSRFKKLGYSAKEYNLPMSRQEIGNYLGLTIETVSRLFSKFQRNGLVTINRKSIRLENLPAIHAICDGFSEEPKDSNRSSL